MEALAVQQSCAQPLSETVRAEIGENINRCWQCVKCTSGCPLADQFDLAPHQVMRSLQFGDARVLEGRALWLCASCYTCATRCPRGIDITSVMNTLRREARRRGVPPAVPEVPKFNALLLRLAKWFGRVPEALLMGAFNLARGRPFADMALGWQLFRRGRLKLWPKIVRTRVSRPDRRIAPLARLHPPSEGSDAKAVAYFPGCASEGSASDYDRTARTAARALDIKLVEPEGWTCCGAGAANATDAGAATVMPFRTIAAVEQMSLDTLTSPCSACFSRLKIAEHQVSTNPAKAEHAAETVGHRYAGTVKVQHLLDTFMEQSGVDDIAARVRRPLTGLKVACYYGCLITRPSRVTGAEHPEYPVKMDQLMQALGAEPVAWSCKTDCCGGSLGITQTEAAVKLSGRILADARACGADLIVTMCPMCHMNLDVRQPRALDGPAIPIVQATQLMVLAFGLGEEEALLDKVLVDVRPLLRGKGLLAAAA